MSRADVVFNIQRTALLVDALHRGTLSLLLVATDDRLRQPARNDLIDTACEHGGGWHSRVNEERVGATKHAGPGQGGRGQHPRFTLHVCTQTSL